MRACVRAAERGNGGTEERGNGGTGGKVRKRRFRSVPFCSGFVNFCSVPVPLYSVLFPSVPFCVPFRSDPIPACPVSFIFLVSPVPFRSCSVIFRSVPFRSVPIPIRPGPFLFL